MVIRNKTFRGLGASPVSPAIYLFNCPNAVVEDNDFIDCAEPIYVLRSDNVRIGWNRYRNITGPHDRLAQPTGNFVQFNHSRSARVHNNKGIGGDTEDIISVYISGGLSSDKPLIIENNHFEGDDWTSNSGTGISLGDQAGSYVIVRNNTLVTPGQVGIGVAGGSGISIVNNVLFSKSRPGVRAAISVWNQSSQSCSAITVAGNKVHFRAEDGTYNSLWNGGGCGEITGTTTNNYRAPLTYEQVRVHL